MQTTSNSAAIPQVTYSIVVPIYNESGNVAALHGRINAVCKTLDGAYEIIFVDDGSSDDSVAIMQTLSPLVGVYLRKNAGQSSALDAGIKQATGEFIITMDGDLQNPPEEIPKLIQALRDQDVDVVSGWRKNRQDSGSKHIVSRVANVLRSIFVQDGIHDSGCTLKIYRRECFEHVDLYGEMHRFIPGLLKWRGFRIGEVVVEHAARTSGVSKYGASRIVRGFLDMLSLWFWRKYSSRPLHLFGGSGIVLSVIGFGGLFVLAIARLFFEYSLSTSIWPMLAILAILVGIQLFVAGLLAEILIKQYYSENRPPYSVKRVSHQ